MDVRNRVKRWIQRVDICCMVLLARMKRVKWPYCIGEIPEFATRGQTYCMSPSHIPQQMSIVSLSVLPMDESKHFSVKRCKALPKDHPSSQFHNRTTYFHLFFTVSILILPSKHPSLCLAFPFTLQKLFKNQQIDASCLPHNKQTHAYPAHPTTIVQFTTSTHIDLPQDHIFLCHFNDESALLSEPSHPLLNNIIVTQSMKEEFTESEAMSLNTSHQRERLIDRLGQVWSQHQISKTYQSIFTEYLSELSMTQFSETLTTEISLTKNRQSFSTTMSQLQQTRRSVMHRLQQEVLTLESKENKTQRDLAILCEIISDLRQANLEYSQLLLNIHHFFQEVVKLNTFSATMAQEFTKLDYENSYLKKSVLRKFILFSKAYDPFFLKHYEVLKTTNNPRLREVACIQQLFNLSANYSYRVEKVQKEILEYLDSTRPYSPERMKKYRIISPIQNSSKIKKKYSYFSSPKQSPQLEPLTPSGKMEESLNAFKLDKDIYLTNRNNTDRIQYQQISIRKSSGDESDSPSNHYRNTSLKSAKEKDYILPRLNTIQSVSNYKDSKETKRTKESSMLTKHYNAYRSINQIEERDQEIKSLIFPKKFQKYDLRKSNQSNLGPSSPSKLQESFIKREMSVQCEPVERVTISQNKEKDIEKSKSPEPKEISIQTVDFKPQKIQLPKQPKQPRQTRQRHKTTMQSSETTRKGKFKKYQLKASNVPIQKIFQLLRSLSFNESYRKIIEIGSWQNSIKHNQYYFHKFFVNDQLCAVSLCCGLPQGDILIKCWGPLQNCDEEMSTFLFGKYIQHIERNTICKTIFYNNFPINQLAAQSFNKKKDRIYERERILTSNCQQGAYHPFLSINFTSVAVSKTTQGDIFTPSNIPEFHTSKFICFNYLLIINKLMTAGSFSDVSAYFPHMPSIQQSNLKILSQFLSPEPYNPAFKCSYCHLLTLKLRNPIKFAFFLADKGYILVPGEVVYQKGESIIVCLPFLRHNTFIYFGKGIKNAQEMAQRCRYNPKEKPEKISFSVRMFRKQLRGKLHSINLKDQHTYGDLQVTFQWRDFLKGKIEHNITDADEIFDGAFYCLIEMQRELLFVFEVQEGNFI